MVEYKLKDIFKFFIIFFIVFFFLWYFVDLREITTYIVGKLLNCDINKNVLICNDHVYLIIKECSGILSIAFLISILIFDLKRINIKYIILGIIVLFVWNIFRITLVIVSNGDELLHSSTWFVSVLLVLIFTYLAYFKKSEEK